MTIQRCLEDACHANLELVRQGLVLYTWGNVSVRDRRSGLIVIKPSGLDYARMTPEDMVVLDIHGAVVQGSLRPSSDAPTHLALYRAYEQIGAVAHTHSPWATAWAQAGRALPCLGTTHADHFYGAVPCTRAMTKAEIQAHYELETGHVIIEALAGLDPLQMGAALVRDHGPFTWGATSADAVANAAVLERCAMMASATMALNPAADGIAQALLDRHYLRKHGAGAYYGQS